MRQIYNRITLIDISDILPPPNLSVWRRLPSFCFTVLPHRLRFRERFAKFSVLTSSPRLDPLILEKKSGYGGLEGSSQGLGCSLWRKA